jgi:phosphopantetheine adenylyltransferase
MFFGVQVTDDVLSSEKSIKLGQHIQSYADRVRQLFEWIEAQTPDSISAFFSRLPIPRHPNSLDGADPRYPYRGRYSFNALHDGFGDTTKDPRYTCIVCSEETVPGCRTINEKRDAAGMRPLQIVVAPLVLGLHGEKLSSTAIRADATGLDAVKS